MARFPEKEKTKNLAAEGDQFFYSGQRARAVRLFSEALKLEPECVSVLVQRGLALQEDGYPAEAMRDYHSAISLDPRYGPAYYGRAWAKNWRRDFAGELQDAETGLSLDPKNPGMYLRRIGAALTGMRRFREAVEAYTRSIDLNPADEGTIYNRAICYREMGQYSSALEDLKRALELDPDWAWAFHQRGLVHEQMGDLDAALSDFEKALHFDPRYTPSAEARNRIKSAMVKNGLKAAINKTFGRNQ